VFDLLFVIAREWKIGAEEAGEGGAGHTRQRGVRWMLDIHHPVGWLGASVGQGGLGPACEGALLGAQGCTVGWTVECS
jgi:hypothetical protein